MQSEDAGMATAMATMMRDAILWLGKCAIRECITELTDVAPNGRTVDGIGVPYNSVDAVVEASERGPNHEEARPRIPCLEMPRKGYEHKNGAEDG